MASALEYFIKSQGENITYSKGNFLFTVVESGDKVEVRARIHLDHEANATFITLYIPATPHFPSICDRVLGELPKIVDWQHEIECSRGLDGTESLSSALCVFTGRVYLYTEHLLTEEGRQTWVEQASRLGFHLVIRDLDYAHARRKADAPQAFISHDSRNKTEIAEPLALALSNRCCNVWYDEYSLRVGDSLREAIERGLSECSKCILLVTVEFLANEGWAKREYDSIFTRELIDQQKLILPVWVGVDKKLVYNFSPMLADRVAAIWATQLAAEEAAKHVASKVILSLL